MKRGKIYLLLKKNLLQILSIILTCAQIFQTQASNVPSISIGAATVEFDAGAESEVSDQALRRRLERENSTSASMLASIQYAEQNTVFTLAFVNAHPTLHDTISAQRAPPLTTALRVLNGNITKITLDKATIFWKHGEVQGYGIPTVSFPLSIADRECLNLSFQSIYQEEDYKFLSDYHTHHTANQSICDDLCYNYNQITIEFTLEGMAPPKKFRLVVVNGEIVSLTELTMTQQAKEIFDAPQLLFE